MKSWHVSKMTPKPLAIICAQLQDYKDGKGFQLACVASVPVRGERERAFSHSGRAKNGARAKRSKEPGGGGERRERLPAKP